MGVSGQERSKRLHYERWVHRLLSPVHDDGTNSLADNSGTHGASVAFADVFAVRISEVDAVVSSVCESDCGANAGVHVSKYVYGFSVLERLE